MKIKVEHKYPIWPKEVIRKAIEDGVIVVSNGFALINMNAMPAIKLTEEQIEELKEYPKFIKEE